MRHIEPMSHFQGFLELGQVLRGIGGHQHNVFESDAACAWIIESRLDRGYLSGSQPSPQGEGVTFAARGLIPV
jgi:hypothetical protein